MTLSSEQIKKIVNTYGKNPTDTGNTAVQIAILTARINDLTNHLKSNKKDYTTKRALYRLVSTRKSLLDYFKCKDLEKYRTLTKQLKLRNN